MPLCQLPVASYKSIMIEGTPNTSYKFVIEIPHFNLNLKIALFEIPYSLINISTQGYFIINNSAICIFIMSVSSYTL
jgi:hypothetical protein